MVRTRRTSSSLRWLGSAVLGLALTAALAPAPAHAVTFSAPTNFAAGDRPRSVAVGDFNGDSRPDLAVANDNSDNVSILLGNGSGGFTGADQLRRRRRPRTRSRSATSTATRAPTWRSPTSTPNNVSILLGDGSGGFTRPDQLRRRQRRPVSVAVGDFNGDSRPDLAVANVRTQPTSRSCSATAAGASAARPTSPSAASPCSVAVGDFNGDSRPDLAVANFGSNNVSILLGNGSGGFGGPTNFAVGDNPLSVAVGDFNGDSRPDLAVANVQLGQRLDPARRRQRGLQRADQLRRRQRPLLGRGRRLQRRLAPRPGGRERQLGRRLDPARRRQRRLHARRPTSPSATAPDSVAVGDFNGDSRPDLATAN